MTIGIIGAMDEEITILRKQITNQREIEVANCLFINGKLNGREVVLLKSGIGKVNAAMATTILHERFSPMKIINTGSAGGFSEDLSVGDIVVSTEVVHHDVDATAFDYVYGQVPGMPPSYQADEILRQKAMNAIKQIGANGKEGMIATGDSFMDNPERVASIKEKFPQLIAGEMEAASVAQVCYQYGVPFVVIRALSDVAGKESSTSFHEFLNEAATNASNIILHMLKTVE